jgi:hypothetical protein
MVVSCGYVHFRERTLGACFIFYFHCHSITLMGSAFVSICCIMYIVYYRSPD